MPCLLILFIFISSHSASSQCWSEVWADEFSGTSLDVTKWNYDLGTGCPGVCGWGNNEKESYTNSTDNVNVAGGYLNITAKYQAGVGGAGYDFTSGKIHTRNKFDWLYGKFEARMKLPQGTGIWPAFWMLPAANTYGGWPTSGEIDIMEFRGDQITKMNGTLHYGNASPNNQWDGTDYVLSSGDFVNSFHVFSIEWEPGEIRWYVDGTLYKTEKQSPSTLNPASNNATAWPWDQNFYVIMNLAVGGWYTGNPSTATIIGGDANYSRTMEIDYVRVYTDLSAGGFSGSIVGKSSILQNESSVTYTIPATGGATYNWSVTGSGSITSGTGTNSVDIDWGITDGIVSVEKILGCGTGNYNLPVTIQPTHCGLVLEDFENIRYPNYSFTNGVFTQKVNNPALSSQNTSPYCARYVRNASERYDVILLDDFSPGDADDFEKKIKRIFMDVYSNASGRVIEIGFESSTLATPTNYPTGRHSLYRATTSAVNAWETLEFAYVTSPHQALAGTSVDRIVILFQPDTYTGNTFYIDNLLFSHKPNTSVISGQASVCENQTGVAYSVSNTLGSDYTWTVPTDASLTSGATGPNNNSIVVSFGVNSEDVSVIETNTTGCEGSAVSLPVTASACLGLHKGSDRNSIGIYPNPGTNLITLKLNDRLLNGEVKITILDKLGRIMKEYETENNADGIVVDINGLPVDLYLIQISKDGYMNTGSFVKN